MLVFPSLYCLQSLFLFKRESPTRKTPFIFNRKMFLLCDIIVDAKLDNDLATGDRRYSNFTFNWHFWGYYLWFLWAFCTKKQYRRSLLIYLSATSCGVRKNKSNGDICFYLLRIEEARNWIVSRFFFRVLRVVHKSRTISRREVASEYENTLIIGLSILFSLYLFQSFLLRPIKF